MKTLTEKEAENFLEKKGFKIARRVFIKSKEELKKIDISFPWAMKASGKEINHKKAMGGVILNIKNLIEAENSLEKIKKMPGFEEAIIQEMVLGEEFILGLKSTPEFGIALMLGKGGSNVEKEKDISFRIPPIRENDAKQMLKEIKFYDKVKNKVNEEEIIKNILLLSNLAEKNKNIAELDINPLIVNLKEAIVVDARLSI